MNQVKKNSEEATALSLDLQQKEEIDQKVNYYKGIIKAYAELSSAIDKKIESIGESTIPSDIYEKSKLTIEKLEADNSIAEKKKFFEMWLKRSAEYDKKFAIITEECNAKFDEVEAQARAIAEKNIKLKSYMTKYDLEEDKNQKIKNEYYLLLKYEITKITGKGKFANAN